MIKKYTKVEFRKRLTSGEVIRNMRNICELTQKELSEKSEIRQSHISEMEKGKRPVGKKSAEMLAKIFEVPPSFILFAGEKPREGSEALLIEKVKRVAEASKKAQVRMKLIIEISRDVKNPKVAKKIKEAVQDAVEILSVPQTIEKELIAAKKLGKLRKT